MDKPSGLRKWIRRALIAFAVLAVVGLIVVAWIPNPVEVEVAAVERGPLVVTVNEDGRTRVKDRYLVSAPIAGNLARLDLEASDTIKEGQVLARLVPLPPPLLDSRTRAEAKARVDAAAASRHQAQAAVNRARFQRDFAKQEAERALAVVQQGGLARSDADRVPDVVYVVDTGGKVLLRAAHDSFRAAVSCSCVFTCTPFRPQPSATAA